MLPVAFNCVYSKSVFSTLTEANSRVQPGSIVTSSREIGWTSLLCEEWIQPATVEEFETIPLPDHTFILMVSGMCNLEAFHGKSWHGAQYRRGDCGALAPRNIDRVRWHSSECSTIRTIHLSVPQKYFDEAAEEYRRAGQHVPSNTFDALGLRDPLIFALAKSLASNMALGSPDLYADNSARMLATQMLYLSRQIRQEDLARNIGSGLTVKQIGRVMEFMSEHLNEALTLDRLAEEAAVSRFHFSRLFRQRMKMTPHQYLISLRLNRAKLLLKSSDSDIRAVALACGYTHPGRFAAAFTRAFGVRPAQFRDEARSSSNRAPRFFEG